MEGREFSTISAQVFAQFLHTFGCHRGGFSTTMTTAVFENHLSLVDATNKFQEFLEVKGI